MLFESIHLLYIDLYLVLCSFLPAVTCRPYISFHSKYIAPKKKTVVILIDEVVFVKMSFFILESLSDASARVYILLRNKHEKKRMNSLKVDLKLWC